VSVHG
jgi:hypothetical protein